MNRGPDLETAGGGSSGAILLSGMFTSVSPKLLNDVALEAIREQRETGSEGQESKAGDHRASRAAAG